MLTGFLTPQIAQRLDRYAISYDIDPILDRNLSESPDLIFETIVKRFKKHNLLLFSQPFSGDAKTFSQAVSRIGQNFQSLFRSHDPIRTDKEFGLLHPNFAIGLPTSVLIDDQMRKYNPKIKVLMLPENIEEERFYKPVNRQAIRRKYNIRESDFVIFQPTRIDPNKRIDRIIYLAKTLQEDLRKQGKKVFIWVACGNEPIEKSQHEKQRLSVIATELDFPNLLFLNGLLPEEYAAYMKSCDLVTFLSETESFGMPPVESCFAQTPCLVTRYTNPEGKPLFDRIFEDFQFIVEEDLKGVSISKNTVSQIKQLIKFPETWKPKALLNLQLSQQYSSKAVKQLARSLLKDISNNLFSNLN